MRGMTGFYFMPKAPGGGHIATPVKDSWYEERTQLPASLIREASYPVVALCQACSQRIRLAEKNQMEWVHVPEEKA